MLYTLSHNLDFNINVIVYVTFSTLNLSHALKLHRFLQFSKSLYQDLWNSSKRLELLWPGGVITFVSDKSQPTIICWLWSGHLKTIEGTSCRKCGSVQPPQSMSRFDQRSYSQPRFMNMVLLSFLVR